ncbi:cytosol aminopeptidase [Exaiptasia diaphana]|uniref:Cytosol aminopeptidase n=1 Tax=Exaiptasia diaphana TaxID=2652724 RepID=A0A913XQM3_EXADI|nr:cytosol aminopeptidase [Exaiptasia diaphana]
MAASIGIYRRFCFSLRPVLLQNRGLCSAPQGKHVIQNGVVLGAYEVDGEESAFKLTRTAAGFNSKTSGRFKEILKIAGFNGKLGNSKTFYGIDRDYPCVVAVGLGKELPSMDLDTAEEHEGAANVRHAAAAGARALRSAGVQVGEIEAFTDAQSAAEGSILSLYSFDKLKSPSKHKLPVELKLYGEGKNIDRTSHFRDAWDKGKIMANSQNFARDLSSTPANLMTPTIFTHTVKDRLGQLDNINIKVRGEEWARNMKMEAFLCVGKGSTEESLFMEITYTGSSDSSESPIVFVGKGVTFDSGGISIKPSAGMAQMKADMTGAATVCAAIEAIALLNLPVNVTVLTPLCENMVSGNAVKPGDVVKAMNGKTIEVDNTDAEGRLILADALCYADSLSPSVVIDVATLTGAIDVAIGQGAAGVFSNSRFLWHQIVQAGFRTGERMWRMPLFEHYKTQIKSDVADLKNVGKTRGAGACTAAAFLKEFTKCKHWAHLDIAGIMGHTDALPYLDKGFPGRPTRALVELVSKLTYSKIE